MPCNSNRNSGDRQSCLSTSENLTPRASMTESPGSPGILSDHFFNSSRRQQNYRATTFSLLLHPLISLNLPSDPTVIDIVDAAIDIVNKDFGLDDEDSDTGKMK
ncbi:hypothetical protein IV203_012865 [Nitzschia inconspicua]|uniref:Uncharacterized protein n=1 Tax=Nitzschia inconspicua TaxID=303405 RepID=A0A9K3M5V2_9STRA|nr:hypothetical protein IV203_012865 [Nitzschia inconspicua]